MGEAVELSSTCCKGDVLSKWGLWCEEALMTSRMWAEETVEWKGGIEGCTGGRGLRKFEEKLTEREG